ncbi:MAG TPA: DNA-formamidopyrimidine glycosylase family protein [Acidimicrobiales bacterium]|nr:DNA-formamidopyrimidine glycosylase family protein [Acidimicrobiales bacterium]
MPEVQAHAERLTEDFAGDALKGFRPITFTALKTFSPAPEEAVGHPLVDVGRRGKYLLLRFEPVTFVVHLMQGGRLKPDEKQAAKPRGGQARWTFADGRALLLTEAGTERKAGVWVVAGEPDGQAPLDDLGPEAADIDRATLAELLAAHNMRLHGWLRDQHIVAGLGRRLANEICHRAKLSPFASTGKLDDDAVDRLCAAIGECIAESLAYERTRSDMSSSKDRPGAVHHREGEACPVCGDTVRAVEYSRYTVNYCPTCQTGGKILADNTTSKFLK